MNGNDLGVVLLGDTLAAAVVVTDGAGQPADPVAPPSYRVYGSGGALMGTGTGSLNKLDTGAVASASNASPIVITAPSHGLQTGMSVILAGVGGNAAANGTFRITRLTADTFALDGSAGTGAYTSGGTWHVAGLYLISVPATGGMGYEAGKTYQALVGWRVGSVDYAMLCPFRVA